jgi:hypothetical protein
MDQLLLLPDCAAKGRWQPVVPPFRVRPAIKVRRTKPLPGQLYLPGMEPTEDNGRSRLPEDDGLALYEEAGGGPQPRCPNCGGMEFDEDGDCTSCWEPGVVEVAGRQRRRR